MAQLSRKIINDPVYGFITLDHPLLLNIVAHPYYQRLRRIHQMAFAHLVYPGAVHTRLHHSLGAYHLMGNAVAELRRKGVVISEEEELGVKTAILLHDIGHGPFSHALENVLIRGVHHERLSLLIMQQLNEEFDGQLDTAIRIFTNTHPKRFLHQLVSGQLDMDRMDYLTRDSFFTGVSEGVIGYDRILKMLTVHDGSLMVEEKGIYSIEKFLVARRLMYWQGYLHKTVLSAEQMLVRILTRAKELVMDGRLKADPDVPLYHFLEGPEEVDLDRFCRLDDSDVEGLLKRWASHPDVVLSTLSRWLIDRRLLKIRLGTLPTSEEGLAEARRTVARNLGIGEREAGYFVFDGTATNSTYDARDEKIRVLFKDGEVRDISQVDNALIHQTLASPVKKFYFCFPRS